MFTRVEIGRRVGDKQIARVRLDVGEPAAVTVGRHDDPQIRIVAMPVVIAGALMVWFRWWPDPTRVPEPKLLFIAGKSFVTPIRLIQFLALIAAFSAAYPYIAKALPRLVDFLSTLGRNSLPVFCAGSILSLGGQIVRFYFRGGIVTDTLLVVTGIILLRATAWLAEWRDRVYRPL